MSKKYPYIFFLLYIVSTVVGQSKKVNSGYISIHGGAYTILSENYKKYYDSKFGTMFGASLGIPLNNKIHLFSKISYFEKNAIPTSDITGLREGSAILKQVLFNGGIQLKILKTIGTNLYIQTGATFAIIDEERKNKNGGFTYEIEGNGNFGIFVGSIVEIIGNSSFFLTGEFNYIYSWIPILEYDDTYKAVNIIGGIRYYLNH